MSSITPVGGNVVTNYINGKNTGQRIVVTLPTNDATIVGGKLLIGALLLLYIYYKNFDKKDEDEEDIEIIEGDDAKLSQIERLASLKEKGHISAEEFQKKKKELL